ncbi:hypothetical protein HN51_060025 [Arachis hypogaea]|uniref:UDP-glycosyltransferase 73C6 n=1 Tax=Arachis hypogaea TaxID=3818 RepID=UPI000DEDC6F9|nr:UDP-glycosyltransferase 73C6 isoform X1 [Arachis hypogaea]QHN83574.1 UDP-glycosyltransferase [Arachis hypogaea]
MAPQTPQLHFVLFPLMAQGHLIPMMDLAKLLLQRNNNIIVTVVTTPKNAARFTSTFARYIDSGYQIRQIQLQFPYQEAGLPEGCENLDMLHSLGNAFSFFNAASLLREPVEKIFEELSPPACCIVSDMSLPYTIHVAKKFRIPRVSFAGVSCFCLMCYDALHTSNVRNSVKDETEYFVIPGLPDEIEVTKSQVPAQVDENWSRFGEEIYAAESDSYGVIMNSFQELEPEYERMYKKVRKDKVWCVGPVSLSNKDQLEKVQRGNSVSVEEWKHQNWLDSQKPKSVIYVCLGSLSNVTAIQLIEIGLALEESRRPFIWVIREGNQLGALEKWIKEDGFEERIKGKSLIIRGWAPQLLILSHPSIGGFLTHCGWNSTLEAICAGMPMLTWPLFADQFLNEKLVVKVLKVGVMVGVKSPTAWGKEEEVGELVKKEYIKIAIEELMDENNGECEERRERIRKLAEMAKRSVEEGGSSHSNLTVFIQDILHKSMGGI